MAGENSYRSTPNLFTDKTFDALRQALERAIGRQASPAELADFGVRCGEVLLNAFFILRAFEGGSGIGVRWDTYNHRFDVILEKPATDYEGLTMPAFVLPAGTFRVVKDSDEMVIYMDPDVWGSIFDDSDET